MKRTLSHYAAATVLSLLGLAWMLHHNLNKKWRKLNG
jgi:hypothetical protein